MLCAYMEMSLSIFIVTFINLVSLQHLASPKAILIPPSWLDSNSLITCFCKCYSCIQFPLRLMTFYKRFCFSLWSLESKRYALFSSNFRNMYILLSFLVSILFFGFLVLCNLQFIWNEGFNWIAIISFPL